MHFKHNDAGRHPLGFPPSTLCSWVWPVLLVWLAVYKTSIADLAVLWSLYAVSPLRRAKHTLPVCHSFSSFCPLTLCPPHPPEPLSSSPPFHPHLLILPSLLSLHTPLFAKGKPPQLSHRKSRNGRIRSHWLRGFLSLSQRPALS